MQARACIRDKQLILPDRYRHPTPGNRISSFVQDDFHKLRNPLLEGPCDGIDQYGRKRDCEEKIKYRKPYRRDGHWASQDKQGAPEDENWREKFKRSAVERSSIDIEKQAESENHGSRNGRGTTGPIKHDLPLPPEQPQHKGEHEGTVGVVIGLPNGAHGAPIRGQEHRDHPDQRDDPRQPGRSEDRGVWRLHRQATHSDRSARLVGALFSTEPTTATPAFIRP